MTPPFATSGLRSSCLGEGDTRGPLLLRLGKALALLGETDFEVLQEAKDELLAAGDEEGAADAETEACRRVLASR